MRSKGFAPIIIFLILAGLGVTSFFAIKTFKPFTLKTSIETPRPFPSFFEPTTSPISTSQPNKATQKPTSTSKSYSKTSSPTPKKTTQGTSCQYDLGAPTGALKINIKAQAGTFGCCALSAELQASPGCKVLDGRSTDKQTLVGNTNSPTITYSSVPPGSYTVRVQNNNQWSESKTVSITATQLTTIELTVPGVAPTPSPTLQKPICSLIAIPSSGNTPLLTNLIPGNNSSPYIAIQSVYWDFEGNGSWDLTASDLSSQNYTYQTPGTYNPKVYFVAINGQASDICQTTVTAN